MHFYYACKLWHVGVRAHEAVHAACACGFSPFAGLFAVVADTPASNVFPTAPRALSISVISAQQLVHPRALSAASMINFLPRAYACCPALCCGCLFWFILFEG